MKIALNILFFVIIFSTLLLVTIIPKLLSMLWRWESMNKYINPTWGCNYITSLICLTSTITQDPDENS